MEQNNIEVTLHPTKSKNPSLIGSFGHYLETSKIGTTQKGILVGWQYSGLHTPFLTLPEVGETPCRFPNGFQSRISTN